VANPYSQSAICDNSGGLSVQNVFFRWEDGSPGCVNDLIQWAEGRLLLLVFGDQSAQARHRLVDLTRHAPVRCVQVLGTDTRRQSLETVRDPQGHLQGACHVFGHAWALVRPDAYLAATGEAVDSALVRAVEHALALA
jgi:3-(3-hydroxy-phenyl)propionate hydroxylase